MNEVRFRIHTNTAIVKIRHSLGPVVLLLQAQALNLDVSRDAQQVLRMFDSTYFTIMLRATIAIVHDDGFRAKSTQLFQ